MAVFKLARKKQYDAYCLCECVSMQMIALGCMHIIKNLRGSVSPLGVSLGILSF